MKYYLLIRLFLINVLTIAAVERFVVKKDPITFVTQSIIPNSFVVKVVSVETKCKCKNVCFTLSSCKSASAVLVSETGNYDCKISSNDLFNIGKLIPNENSTTFGKVAAFPSDVYLGELGLFYTYKWLTNSYNNYACTSNAKLLTIKTLAEYEDFKKAATEKFSSYSTGIIGLDLNYDSSSKIYSYPDGTNFKETEFGRQFTSYPVRRYSWLSYTNEIYGFEIVDQGETFQLKDGSSQVSIHLFCQVNII